MIPPSIVDVLACCCRRTPPVAPCPSDCKCGCDSCENQRPQNTTIFAIVCSVIPQLHDVSFYATKELARQELKKLLKDRQHRMGVTITVNTEDKFSFILGWEERQVTFCIQEIVVHNS
jgi:hypothetical protein